MMPGTEELLQKEMVTAYLGTDPTADSLHIGHLCGIMMLRHLQRCGHKPIILVGGATGMIGDPSGKSQERNLLNEETLRHNQECIKKQVAKFLDFESKEPNAAEMVNNYDWMKDFTFLDFAREVGKHITVNYMMAKDRAATPQRHRPRRPELHRIHLPAAARLRLPLALPAQELQAATRRQRPMGQHHHGHGTDSQNVRLRERGFRPHLSAHHQGRRQEVRQDRERSPRPTARSSARPRAVTSGSTRNAPRLTSSTSSGST